MRRTGGVRQTDDERKPKVLLSALFLFMLAESVNSTCLGARAEYLCKAPPTAADKKVRELAKLNRPDELRHYVQRTQSVDELYMLDDVSEEDAKRWELARRIDTSRSIRVMDLRNQNKSASR